MKMAIPGSPTARDYHKKRRMTIGCLVPSYVETEKMLNSKGGKLSGNSLRENSFLMNGENSPKIVYTYPYPSLSPKFGTKQNSYTHILLTLRSYDAYGSIEYAMWVVS